MPTIQNTGQGLGPAHTASKGRGRHKHPRAGSLDKPVPDTYGS